MELPQLAVSKQPYYIFCCISIFRVLCLLFLNWRAFTICVEWFRSTFEFESSNEIQYGVVLFNILFISPWVLQIRRKRKCNPLNRLARVWMKRSALKSCKDVIYDCWKINIRVKRRWVHQIVSACLLQNKKLCWTIKTQQQHAPHAK